ncbi:MAG: hypothetical protein QUS13_08115 [Smithella sp.]|nr:hypothetical protein [Smithella sp.]
MRFVIINGIKLSLGEKEETLAAKVADALKVKKDDIKELDIVRKSLDARRHRPPFFVYLLKIKISPDVQLPRQLETGLQISEAEDIQDMPGISPVTSPKHPVVIIGSGPAGLFAAYHLAQSRIFPTILERGEPIEKRIKDVEEFWEKGMLNTQSNVFFGEGGAGTFSDGKLTSRSQNPYSRRIKEILVETGASSEILVDSKPHIGTDKLRRVIVNLRKKLIEMGCRIEFNARVSDFIINNGQINSVIVNEKEEISTNHLILAIGQSADDTYEKLYQRGVQMESKPFAMGVRVEHPQALINSIQYGQWHKHPQLPPAEYFVKASLPGLNRSVYTFCMCPGGAVIACSASHGSLITNGMSNSRRSGEFANSAVVVNVRVDDFASAEDPLAGLAFRKIWEQKAFVEGGSNYSAPAQKATDFLRKKISDQLPPGSFLPGVKSADLRQVLPAFTANAINDGIREFDKKMSGFVSEESILIGVETRTSSPLRICRGKDGQSLSVRGIYPCGEGAGYAGGIISSAVDGIKVAQNLIANLT